MTKYEHLLNQAAEDNQKEQNQFKAEEALLQLQADKLATRQEASRLNQQLQLKKASYPLDSKGIIELKDKLDSCSRGLVALEDLEKDMFSPLPEIENAPLADVNI